MTFTGTDDENGSPVGTVNVQADYSPTYGNMTSFNEQAYSPQDVEQWSGNESVGSSARGL